MARSTVFPMHGVRVVFYLSSIALGAISEAQTSLSAVQGRTAFAIAVVDTFPYSGTDAVIIRRTNAEISDVIVVRPGKATDAILASAVLHLGGLRASQGNKPLADGVFRVRNTGKRWPRNGEPTKWSLMINRARPHDLEGFGVVRHVVLFLPNQRRQ